MFKKFYRAMILSRAASAANETLKHYQTANWMIWVSPERLLSVKLSTVSGKT